MTSRFRSLIFVLIFFGVVFSYPSLGGGYRTGSIPNPASVAEFMVDVDAFAPSPYGLELISTRSVGSQVYLLDVARFTTDKDQLVAYGNFYDSNNSKVEVYGLSGNTLVLSASKNFNLFNSDTNLATARGVTRNGIVLTGSLYPNNRRYGFLGFLSFNGTTNGPTLMMPFSSFPNQSITDFEYGPLVNYTNNYLLFIQERISSSGRGGYRTIVAFKSFSPAAYYTYNFSTDYLSYFGARIGHFRSSALRDAAFIGYSYPSSSLHLFAVEGGALTKVSTLSGVKTSTDKNIIASSVTKSDLDRDGKDEFIIAGAYDRGGSFSNYSEVLQVYKYDAAGGVWERKAEFLNATPGSAEAIFVGIADVDSDNREEIVTVSRQRYRQGSVSLTRARVNIFSYNSTTRRLNLLFNYDFQAPSPSDSNYYVPESAALGDFNNDSRKELAILYYDEGNREERLAVFKLGKDLISPSLTFYQPTNSTISGRSNLSVSFYAYDQVAVNPSSLKVKLTGPSGYDSGFKTGSTTGSTNQYRYLTVRFATSALSPGNYTLLAEATDAAGNRGQKTKSITLLSNTASSALAPDPSAVFASNESVPPIPEPVVNVTRDSAEDVITTNETFDVLPDESTISEVLANVSGSGNSTTTTAPPPASSTNASVLPANSAASSSNDSTVPPLQNTTNTISTVPFNTTNNQTVTALVPATNSTTGRLISELEIKISVARQQGKDVTDAQASLEQAKALDREGRLADAALEAQKGMTKVDQILKPQDYTLLIIGGIAAGIAVFLYFFIQKKK